MATAFRPIAGEEPAEKFELRSSLVDDPLGIRIGDPGRWAWMSRLRIDTQIGSIWLGFFGFMSVVFAGVAGIITFWAALDQSGNNPWTMVRFFANLEMLPPDGLAMAQSLRGGGYWQMTLVAWAASVAFWALRCWERLMKHQWRPWLFFAWISAIFLTFSIWVLHPIIVGTWADAPALGLNGDIQWAQNFSVLWGNFYYNPWHQLAIFFLFGSTMLWGMHGATILATADEGTHHEDAEIHEMHSGSHKSMLFWRWTMGFNATPKSIHDWLWWFSVGTVLASAMGILQTSTVTNDWYVWGVDHGTVAQYGEITRSAINQRPAPMPTFGSDAGYMPGGMK